MKQLLIEFDRSSLVIPEEDYDIFRNENYYIDDGTTHIFYEDCNGLLVLNTDKKPETAIFFSKVVLEGETQYEICTIKKVLNKDISPQTDLKQAQKAVLSVIKETFILLDGILKKRAKPNQSFRSLGFKYYVLDKETPFYNVAISLEDRFSYLQFISQLDYGFTIIDD